MDLFSDIYEDTNPQSAVIVMRDNSISHEVAYFSCGSIHGFFVLQIDKTFAK